MRLYLLSCLTKTLYVYIFLKILIRNRATELDARMNDGTTPLILAARLAVEGMVEELIHCHGDINAVDDHGQHKRTLLFYFMWNVLMLELKKVLSVSCHKFFTFCFKLNFRAIVAQCSIVCDADVSGKSALHWAAAVNNVEATLVLLKNGANRDMQDNKVASFSD